jgi:hypothetical protein
MAYANLWAIIERGLKKDPNIKRPRNQIRNKCQVSKKDKEQHMKKLVTVLGLVSLVLIGNGCAAFTKGIDTARGTVVGAIDTVRAAVDSGFATVGKGASAAEKIADAANAGVSGGADVVTSPEPAPVTPAQ